MPTVDRKSRPGVWAGTLFASMGIYAGLAASGAIEQPATTLLLIIPLILGFQVYRSIRDAAENRNAGSPAIARYNRRFAMASAGYMLAMGAAMIVWNRYQLSDPLIVAIALLPAAPTFAMIAVMARYLAEEDDEYLRYRSVLAALWGLGVVLALGTLWGFMEMFGLVPHVFAWWVLPVWAIGMGFGQYWHSRGADA